jgi:glutathione S-transferase
MLKLYGFSRVNPIARGNTRDLRILWALEEMQLPFELVGMDHPAHDLSADPFRRLNPFQQIPTIEDDGMVLTESGAILIYLAKKAGKLIPRDAQGEAQVVRWCFVALNSIEMPLLNLQMMSFGGQGPENKYHEFLMQWASRHLKNLESWLTGREFIVTESFTIADILMAHVLTQVKDESLLTSLINVRNYRDRCFARPAWKKTIESYCERVKAG